MATATTTTTAMQLLKQNAMPSSKETMRAMQNMVTIDGIIAASKVVYKHISPTPLMEHPLLSERLGIQHLRIKHENHLPTGAFKLRGGLNYMHHFAASNNGNSNNTGGGVITATRGNHGQSIALACKLYGIQPCIVVVPEGNNPEKNNAMRAHGATLVEHGKDYDQARALVETMCRRQEDNLTYVHSGNEPHLIHGVGTYSLEIVRDQWPNDVDTIIVPVGGGSGICGAITVVRALKPSVRIVGVQAANASSVYQSWKKGGVATTTETAHTVADGLATRCPFALPLSIMAHKDAGVDEFVLVTEDEIKEAVRVTWETTHNVAEGAAAAAMAATIKLAPQLRDSKVVTVLSGSNMDAPTLQHMLQS